MRELWLSLLKVTNILTNVLFLFTKNACIHSLFNSWLPVAILDCIYCQIKDMHGILPERHVVTFFPYPLVFLLHTPKGKPQPIAHSIALVAPTGNAAISPGSEFPQFSIDSFENTKVHSESLRDWINTE